jgi:hypothetical protein
VKVTVVRFGESAPANRNYTCDKCGLVIKPRSAGYNAWKVVKGQQNDLRFGIKMDPEEWRWNRKPFEVTICKGCAAFFAELHRTREYARVIQGAWRAMAGITATEEGEVLEAEKEDQRRIMQMQSKAYERFEAQQAWTYARLYAWWPELEAKVVAHENMMLNDPGETKDPC